MLELAAFGARKRVKGVLALSVGLSAFSAMYAAFFPSVTEGIDLDSYIDSMPQVFVEAFGLRALGTIEGFLATELYQFAWVILLGLYIAYSAASLVASDVENDRLDVILTPPVPRARVVGEKFLELVAVHLLSLPYLFACTGIGLAFSVVADRASIAQRAAMATVFGLFLLESIVTGTDWEWVGAIAPMRYFDPTAILVDGRYDVAAAAILTLATVALVVASQWYFGRKDIN